MATSLYNVLATQKHRSESIGHGFFSLILIYAGRKVNNYYKF